MQHMSLLKYVIEEMYESLKIIRDTMEMRCCSYLQFDLDRHMNNLKRVIEDNESLPVKGGD